MQSWAFSIFSNRNHVRDYVRNGLRTPALFRLCSPLLGIYEDSRQCIDITRETRTEKHAANNAEREDRIFRDQEVGGSNPLAPTNRFFDLRHCSGRPLQTSQNLIVMSIMISSIFP
ncbi:MAG TPA: hypothetical protein VH640_10055, partial [Bryobacteraceae bacterium]